MPGRTYDDGRARYLSRIAPIRPMLLDDQVKLNDPGASQYHHQHAGAGRLERPAALLRRRDLAPAQPRRRRCPRGAGLCRRRRLSRRAGRRLALARPDADQAGRGSEAKRARLRALSADDAQCARRAVRSPDGRLRSDDDAQDRSLLLAAGLLARRLLQRPAAKARLRRLLAGPGQARPGSATDRWRSPRRANGTGSAASSSSTSALVEDWTQNGPYLDGISFVTGLQGGEYLVRQRSRDDRQVPKFRSNMTAPEIAAMLESCSGFAAARSISRRCACSRGRSWAINGFQFDFEHLDSDEVWRKGRAVGAVIDGRLYLILFDAARSHYYANALPDFEAWSNSRAPAAARPGPARRRLGSPEAAAAQATGRRGLGDGRHGDRRRLGARSFGGGVGVGTGRRRAARASAGPAAAAAGWLAGCRGFGRGLRCALHGNPFAQCDNAVRAFSGCPVRRSLL